MKPQTLKTPDVLRRTSGFPNPKNCVIVLWNRTHLLMNQLNTTHLAYGVFLFTIIAFFLWKNRRKGNKLQKEIIESLRTTIDSYHHLTFSEYYGLPESCALKTDEWHVGCTLYFACCIELTLESIVAIVTTDLAPVGYVVIHKQEDILNERQLILLKKGSRTFKMFVTHGAKSDANMNVFSIHVELNP